MNEFKVGIKRQLYNYKMRELRLKRGLSQKQLGYETDITTPVIGLIEQIKRVPTVSEADMISMALDADPEVLFPSELYSKLVEKVADIQRNIYIPVTKETLDCVDRNSIALPDYIEISEEQLNIDVIEDALLSMQEREARVLRFRFGLYDSRENYESGNGALRGVFKTLEDAAREFGLTRERIRQIESGALKKLKKYLLVNHSIDLSRYPMYVRSNKWDDMVNSGSVIDCWKCRSKYLSEGIVSKCRHKRYS